MIPIALNLMDFLVTNAQTDFTLVLKVDVCQLTLNAKIIIHLMGNAQVVTQGILSNPEFVELELLTIQTVKELMDRNVCNAIKAFS